MCTHTIVTHQFVGDQIVAAFCAVPSCNARLSLGPSNDAGVPADEIITAVVAHCDADHAAIEEDGAFSWDPSHPLAEQWPWSGEKLYDGLHTRAQLAEMDREEDELRAQAVADRKAEEHAELVGPTDHGQPLTDAECATIIAQSSRSYEPPNCRGEPFATEDSASVEPWADPSATTRLTDDELVTRVAYCPPGGVQE